MSRLDPRRPSRGAALDAEWTREREERFVARVLARTTRRPGRARKPGSVFARGLAAAGVLFALIALGLRVLRAPATGEPLADSRSAAAIPPRLEPARERTSAEIQDALASARLALETSTASGARGVPVDAPARAPLELKLLGARAKGLRQRRWDGWLKEIPLAQAGTLALALWCEVQLDRYVLTGELPPAWRTAETLLCRRAAEPVVATGSGRLLTRALDRAHAYGLADSPPAGRAWAHGDLWSQAWFDDLAGAGREEGLGEEPLWRAWVEWHRE